MLVIFVHGWSVRHTDTYGDFPEWLATQGAKHGAPINVGNVYLGKYVSFDDSVTVDDLARAFQQAIADEISDKLALGERFACITHSTGAPVIRKWIDLYHARKLALCPLSHLVMLAPANHGSTLAQLGKSRISRLKFFAQGAEPGVRVLDWLELGSALSWTLNRNWLDYDCVGNGLYPFVLTGQSIDRSFSDNLNRYTDEPGSDGVVRVAATNMNYGLLRLRQEGGTRVRMKKFTRGARMGLAVLPRLSHSGEDIGIIRSVTLTNAANHATVQAVLACLAVASPADYDACVREFDVLTEKTQLAERDRPAPPAFFLVPRSFHTSRYVMLVFRLIDDRGEELTDYDLYLTAGPRYSENHLPEGFFVDRQRNSGHVSMLTYYLDYDAMVGGLKRPELEGKIGFRIVARPTSGLAHYAPFNFESTLTKLKDFLLPNQTLMIEIELERRVDATAFRITADLEPGPIDPALSGNSVA